MGKIEMNENQIEARNIFLDKISSGEYQLEDRKCICGAEKDHLIAKEDRYGIPLNTVICMNCGLVRSNPFYDEKTLESFYKNDYRLIYTASEQATDEFFTDQVKIGQGIVNYLNISLEGKKVFEVGCGAGGILKAFQMKGAEVYGCDFGDKYLEKGKKEGVTLRAGGAEVLSEFGKADIVILNHVLEHFLNPNEELEKIKTLLKDDGMLYVSVPGLWSHRKAYGSFKWYLQNAHLYSFTLKTLGYLLNLAGFEKQRGNERIRSVFTVNNSVKVQKQSPLVTFFLYIFLKLSYLL